MSSSSGLFIVVGVFSSRVIAVLTVGQSALSNIRRPGGSGLRTMLVCRSIVGAVVVFIGLSSSWQQKLQIKLLHEVQDLLALSLPWVFTYSVASPYLTVAVEVPGYHYLKRVPLLSLYPLHGLLQKLEALL
ncbi:hypothetical protein LTR66_004721 [Elasticomyces elasticus]|nr:hypothetical protein LTR66_004721 [Elasticomyces elasticus]